MVSDSHCDVQKECVCLCVCVMLEYIQTFTDLLILLFSFGLQHLQAASEEKVRASKRRMHIFQNVSSADKLFGR